MARHLKKKGVSPVIATVLLIGMVIVIGLIIFIWLRGLTEEAVIKFEKNAELVCGEVQFNSDYSSGTLTISNIGNVAIYDAKVKILKDKSYSTKDLSTLSEDWPDSGLNPGKVFSSTVSISGEEAMIIPVLIGTSDSGRRSYACEERMHGQKIIL